MSKITTLLSDNGWALFAVTQLNLGLLLLSSVIGYNKSRQRHAVNNQKEHVTF